MIGYFADYKLHQSQTTFILLTIVLKKTDSDNQQNQKYLIQYQPAW